ncbi:MAG TPA: PIG-L deacetylase family protein [Candidatus Acidoferrales bacterium]|nr:PIG-L deacetylase family protein [Candidatus Acidoferrales bacterium]
MIPLARPSRRQLLAVAPAAFLFAQEPSPSRLRVVCVGGHPDDPESGCGGTLARYAALGHAVAILYLTRGEAGIAGKSHEEAARIRTAECEAACRILGARAIFAGQIDGATVVDANAAESLRRLMAAENPDVVLTQWPIDTHLDHQAAGTLAFRAWIASGRKFDLYYYEVNAGSQTLNFHATDYVDITAVREKKKSALFAHKSQDGEAIYRNHHQLMEDFRGREAGVTAAEAFVRLAPGRRRGTLPGL